MWSQDFKELVGLLNEHGVEYLAVGGYAVGVHGYPRYTGDLDVWVSTTPENARRLIQALERFGFGGLGIKEDDFCARSASFSSGNPRFASTR